MPESSVATFTLNNYRAVAFDFIGHETAETPSVI